MAEIMMVRAQLVTDRCFDVESGSGHSVTLDVGGQSGVQSRGLHPMEMLLIGLAGCIGMEVLSMLRKNRQEVTGYEVYVVGKRAEEHPRVFVEITVEHHITGHAIQPDAVARAIALSEKRYGAAGAMLGKTARLTHTYQIDEARATPAIAAALA